MDTLRSVAHLQTAIGADVLFETLISSDHTEAVREFAIRLFSKDIPIEVKIGDRIYEIVSFREGREVFIDGLTVFERAIELGACFSKEEGEYIGNNPDRFPPSLRKVILFMPGWLDHGDKERQHYFQWKGSGDHWFAFTDRGLAAKWSTITTRLLRRK